ncbi:MAG: carbon starvation protein A [Bacteroidaceae bacterium]|nr:carbon starvation protein A [Bacteroidaceae bacterium]
MITFVIALIALVLGFILYGSFVERTFGIQPERETPSYRLQDGVDYIPMPTWRVYLIQFLNIAGTGPIFGAIMGILFGPAAYLWIVFGCIFMGAVHDYLCGMISLRQDGASLPELVGNELGNTARQGMRVLSIVLLVLVGTVFVTTSAGLLATMTNGAWGMDLTAWRWLWIGFVFLYCVLATLLPIDTLIGRLYPLFGAALLIMAIGVGFGLFTQTGLLPEITDAPFVSHHPKGLPIFPFLCITIACGAISGFHGTQSPLMSRCLQNERRGRLVFYGAMITEGIVALIWAAAAIKFASATALSAAADTLSAAAGSTDALAASATLASSCAVSGGSSAGASAYSALLQLLTGNGTTSSNPALLVNMICTTWMGRIGALLAVLGVVAAPITSGDTAYRSARLIVADFMHLTQKKIANRLLLALPLFAISAALVFVDFDVLWRYFAWTNQTLATCFLWTAAVWLLHHKRNAWIAFLPAVFMTVVVTSYILAAPEGFSLSHTPSLIAGFALAIVLAAWFLRYMQTHKNISK